MPIEVMAAGKPVFAYRAGGLLETNIDGVTGGFFDDKNGSDFAEKFKEFHKKNINGEYSAKNCKQQAKQFDTKIFEEKLLEIIGIDRTL